MNFLSGNVVGDIHITVFKTDDNKPFFILKLKIKI